MVEAKIWWVWVIDGTCTLGSKLFYSLLNFFWAQGNDELAWKISTIWSEIASNVIGKYFREFWQNTKLRVLGWFLPFLHLNTPQIVYSSTDHNYRILLGWFGSHFGSIWDKFESIWKPNCKQLKQFEGWFLTQKGLDSPKIKYSGTDHKCTVHEGRLWGQFWGDLVHLGLFGAHLEPILGPLGDDIVLFGLFFGQCDPFMQPKRAFMTFYQIQWTYNSRGSPKCA